MRVLIFGATGMLGHKLVQLGKSRHELAATVRGNAADYARVEALSGAHLISGVEATQIDSAAEALDYWKPSVAINCIGIIKQRPEISDVVAAISVNGLFPHQVAQFCNSRGIKLIQFSTDCVFSGRRGNYTEDDPPDPLDLYDRTKLLGEVTGPGCLTLRTSVIGRELGGGKSLLEWFISQKGKRVKGYAGSIYSGLTTNSMAVLIYRLLDEQIDLDGLWHVSSNPISKYDLLNLINEIYGLGITIERDEQVRCDRSLVSNRFRDRVGFQPEEWRDMIAEMHADATYYMRESNA